MSSKETSPEDTVLDNSIGNVRKAETQVTNNAVFDPFSVHDLVSPSIMIDCATRSVAEELSIDGLRELNGPTVLQQGLTSEAFRVLAADPQALMSVGGSSRKPVIFDTGASLGITYDKDDFDGPLTVPEGDLRLGGMAQGLRI